MTSTSTYIHCLLATITIWYHIIATWHHNSGILRHAPEMEIEMVGSVIIHSRSLQTLTTGMFKVYKNLWQAIITNYFHVRQNNCNSRNDFYFAILSVKSVYYGTESLSNLGPRIWNLVPDRQKQQVGIHAFKEEIKKWKQKNYPCRLCKTYVPNVGFIYIF